VLATTLALALAAHLRRAPAPASTALFIPLAVPAVAAALLAFQFLSGAGLFARLAWHLGLIAAPADFPALIYDRFGLGIILTHTAVAVPLLALLFARLHANERIDDYAALARTLGADRLAVLRRVTLPLLLRRAAPALTLLFAAVFGSYEIPLLLGAQRPEMLSILARRKFALFDLAQRPEGFLLAVIYALIVFALVALVFRKHPPAHVR
jgi:putative spermidine/putrescine transport system permease protein